MKISCSVEFCYGHRLPGVPKCENVHGHNCKLDVVVEGTTMVSGKDIGMVMNFTALKDIIKTSIVDTFDHRFIVWKEDPILDRILHSMKNQWETLASYLHGQDTPTGVREFWAWTPVVEDFGKLVILGWPPTAEFLADWSFYHLDIAIEKRHTNAKLSSVTWHETSNSFACVNSI